jgi:hypothetical protein
MYSRTVETVCILCTHTNKAATCGYRYLRRQIPSAVPRYHFLSHVYQFDVTDLTVIFVVFDCMISLLIFPNTFRKVLHCLYAYTDRQTILQMCVTHGDVCYTCGIYCEILAYESQALSIVA